MKKEGSKSEFESITKKFGERLEELTKIISIAMEEYRYKKEENENMIIEITMDNIKVLIWNCRDGGTRKKKCVG